MNGRTYVEFQKRSNSIPNIQNILTYCFLWSTLASIHPINKDPQRFTKYEPYRNEPNDTNIDFRKSMKNVDTSRFERLNHSLSKIVLD